MYSSCCCSCSFEAEIIKIGQSSHKMYSNNILNFQESTTILNACTKKSGNLLKAPHTWEQINYEKFIQFCPDIKTSIQLLKFYHIRDYAQKLALRNSDEGKGFMATRAFHYVHMVESIPWAAIGC